MNTKIKFNKSNQFFLNKTFTCHKSHLTCDHLLFLKLESSFKKMDFCQSPLLSLGVKNFLIQTCQITSQMTYRRLID
jgi:hypothetical protein